MRIGILGLLAAGMVSAGFASWQMLKPVSVGSHVAWDTIHSTSASLLETNCDGDTGNDEEFQFVDIVVRVRLVLTSEGVIGDLGSSLTPAEVVDECIENLNAMYTFNDQQFSPSGTSRFRFVADPLTVTDGIPGLLTTVDLTEGQILSDRSEESGSGAINPLHPVSAIDKASPVYTITVVGIWGGAAGSTGGQVIPARYVTSIGIICHEFGHTVLSHTFAYTDPTAACTDDLVGYCDVPADPQMSDWTQGRQNNGSTPINKTGDHYSWDWLQMNGYTASTVVKGYTVAQWGQVQFTNVMSYYNSRQRHFSFEQMLQMHEEIPARLPNYSPASIQSFDTLETPTVTAVFGGVTTSITWPKVTMDRRGHLAFVDKYAVYQDGDYSNPVGLHGPEESWDKVSYSIEVDGDQSASVFSVVPVDATDGWSYRYTGEWWDYTGEPQPDPSLLGSWTSEWDDPVTRGGCGWSP